MQRKGERMRPRMIMTKNLYEQSPKWFAFACTDCIDLFHNISDGYELFDAIKLFSPKVVLLEQHLKGIELVSFLKYF